VEKSKTEAYEKIEKLPLEFSNTIKRSTRKIFLAFVLLITVQFFASLFVFDVNERDALSEQVNHTVEVYLLNLAKTVSIFSSSTYFVDFIRSGEVSQKSLKLDLDVFAENIINNEVVGMKLLDQSKAIYQVGDISNDYIVLNLCYLDRILSPDFGKCKNKLLLYFNKAELFNTLQKSNSRLRACDNCQTLKIPSKDRLGLFHVDKSSTLNMKVEITPKLRGYIITSALIFIFILLMFGKVLRDRVESVSRRYLWRPIQNLIADLDQNKVLNIKNYRLTELRFLADQFNIWRKKSEVAEEVKKKASLGKLASEVAHDIRSPLAALNIALEDINLDSEHKEIIDNSIVRIKEIADNLLEKGRVAQKTQNDSQVIQDLQALVSEKKVQYKKKCVCLEANFDESLYWASAKISTSNFQRIVSNLINNSVEARAKKIILSLSTLDDQLRITINDDGSGIPKEILEKFKNKEFASFGKEQGNGIGLAHADEILEKAGGRLIINSSEGTGTSITIELPFYIIDHVENNEIYDLVHIEDDPYLRMAWKLEAKKKDIKILSLSREEELHLYKDNLRKESKFFIDYHLENDRTGYDLASEIHAEGFKEIYISTGALLDPNQKPAFIKDIIGKEPII
jgi:signal transduction histidine kinase